jgi:Ca-activated chloride channel family protein
MIEWAQPWAFVLLLPVLLLPLQPRVTGVNRLRIPGPSAHEGRMTVRRALASLPLLLKMGGLALVVLALARPRISHRNTVVESDGLDIMLAIDTSGSMRQQDFQSMGRAINRLEVAKAVMAAFIEERPYDRIGVVVFGQEAFTHVPLTLDHDTLVGVLDTVQIGIAGENRTAVGSAVAVSAKRLKDLEAPSKIVILLTDGKSNAGRLSPLEAADLAGTLGIKVYTIGIGGQSRRGPFGMVMGDGPDERTLQAVAEATGAKYFRANSTAALMDVYETIDELEPSPAEVEEVVRHDELYRRFLMPGVALLALQALLSATWLRRWP